MKWLFPLGSGSNESPRGQDPASSGLQTARRIILYPFSARRLPKSMCLDKGAHRSYSDLFDVITLNGGMVAWLHRSLGEELDHLGCAWQTGGEGEPDRGDFLLKGEILTAVRANHFGQVAFKIHLSCHQAPIFSKLYSATARPDGAISLANVLGLDGVLRPPFNGPSNRHTNQLLSQAVTGATSQVAEDLSRVLPYRTTSNSEGHRAG